MPRWAWWVLGAAAVIAVFKNPAGSALFVQQVLHSVFTFIGRI